MSEEIKQAEPTAETSRDCRKGRPLSAKGFTSLFLTLTFGAVASSGAILYLTPRGRVANWTDWTMLGLSKDEWAAL
ncbi:MAG: DUF4405 domain-containing protein, partial [Planctomycetota bacterium]|nr:DUF4405 domain-containing protein [Planctomycetota bacterium]